MNNERVDFKCWVLVDRSLEAPCHKAVTLTADRHLEIKTQPIAFKNEVLCSQLAYCFDFDSPELITAVWHHRTNHMQVEHNVMTKI